ncbi:AbrB/MazE/SpoVT family DNA-binding domain-containing protein [Ruminococcus sp. HUN007]|uniref:AbrB/MazE/SpoVT family DNA-binding domain-containing protein n=1 Tax=Ruminococcus sp. HUN007 TaxID=1514668 RepID=UPI0005D22525|nr:AbrB/MazE/SpoVT family DNA-binding domain-containing protein [Ruminococcus sp. HUN007]
MKSTGIVRKIDELGRIVLPKELRRTLGLNDRESVEIYVDQDAIILKKFKSTCVLCGDNEDLLDFKGKSICQKCMNELRK